MKYKLFISKFSGYMPIKLKEEYRKCYLGELKNDMIRSQLGEDCTFKQAKELKESTEKLGKDFQEVLNSFRKQCSHEKLLYDFESGPDYVNGEEIEITFKAYHCANCGRRLYKKHDELKDPNPMRIKNANFEINYYQMYSKDSINHPYNDPDFLKDYEELKPYIEKKIKYAEELIKKLNDLKIK